MYFSDKAIKGEILSVLELSWKQQDLHSGLKPYHALSFRIKGGSKMISDDDTVRAATGDMLLVPAHYPYRQISEKEELIVVHFLSDTPLPRRIVKFTPQDPAYYETKFRDLLSAWSRRASGYQYECQSIFARILFKAEQQANNAYTAHDPLCEIMEYISEHFTDRDMSLETLARRHGMSGAYLRRQFSERYGIPPMRYIQKSRLRLAKALLQTNYYSIEQVAEKCGFSNVYYFSSFIKKETGLPPSKLKQIVDKS